MQPPTPLPLSLPLRPVLAHYTHTISSQIFFLSGYIRGERDRVGRAAREVTRQHDNATQNAKSRGPLSRDPSRANAALLSDEEAHTWIGNRSRGGGTLLCFAFVAIERNGRESMSRRNVTSREYFRVLACPRGFISERRQKKTLTDVEQSNHQTSDLRLGYVKGSSKGTPPHPGTPGLHGRNARRDMRLSLFGERGTRTVRIPYYSVDPFAMVPQGGVRPAERLLSGTRFWCV
ncbi:hypothetical protein BKA62DRAFT_52956 [Auriculariales sp. MPI-PUGE-AT-0066]|nr:hypothetical protein BKA62DRAFT_52956 [Auriculariales sp. MPI-PUGE-AT-0066]